MSLKILVVGQTPPPYGGQAVMIERMLQGRYNNVHLIHLRMNFSREMDEIGKFHPRKIFFLLAMVFRTYYFRVKEGCDVLYYPPAGEDKVPMIRDLIYLNLCRPLFRKVIFHFHAGGVSKYLNRLNPVLKFLFKRAYLKPDVSIEIVKGNFEDAKALMSKKIFYVPNGMNDTSKRSIGSPSEEPLSIVFIGMVRYEKGVDLLIDALGHIVNTHKREVLLNFIGRFESKQYESKIRTAIREQSLESHVVFHGVKIGNEKESILLSSDIFCLPTYFETFGLVCIEAMAYQLPVVATDITPIRSILKDNEFGLLFRKGDSKDLSRQLMKLIDDVDLREKLAVAGRQRFFENYTTEKFHDNFNQVFDELYHQVKG